MSWGGLKLLNEGANVVGGLKLLNEGSDVMGGGSETA